VIAIVYYDAGNLLSVDKALKFLGCETAVTGDAEKIRRADAVVLPGVGAFLDAMASLEERGLVGVLKEQAAVKPLLGICLGMQLLFERGYEFGDTKGLSLIPGDVARMEPEGLKIPHMGWNSLSPVTPSPLTELLAGGEYVYFVHSYAARTHERYINAVTHYGRSVPAIVSDGRFVHGAQFHPEKSGEVGLALLRRFCFLSGGERAGDAL